MVALGDILRADTALGGVQIVDGLPMSPQAEFVAILDAQPHEQRAAGMRATPHPREEEFTLTLHISVVRRGDASHEKATARAYEIAAVIEDALRSDLTINGSLGNGWATVDGLPLTKFGPNRDGEREAVILAQVGCRARI